MVARVSRRELARAALQLEIARLEAAPSALVGAEDVARLAYAAAWFGWTDASERLREQLRARDVHGPDDLAATLGRALGPAPVAAGEVLERLLDLGGIVGEETS